MESGTSRRTFLKTAAGVAGAGAIYTAFLASPIRIRDSGGTLRFADESSRKFHKPFGEGLDGRLITDLRRVTQEHPVIPNEHFFIRTQTPDQIDFDAPWTVSVGGLVDQSRTLRMEELLERTAPQGEVLLECSGNERKKLRFGLMSLAEWDGVSVAALLGEMKALRSATGVLVEGFDGHSKNVRRSVKGASWIFTLDQLKASGAFLATRMNGESLPRDHGYPVRLIVPGWYGCCCIKWVNRIEFLDETAEATSQMTEFATRTHQSEQHPLVKDYLPATIDLAAMPVRVEKRDGDGTATDRVAGIYWGGDTANSELLIRFNADTEFVPVQTVFERPHPRTWGVWSHEWTPEAPGRYEISLKAADARIRTRRLDIGYYRRYLDVTDV